MNIEITRSETGTVNQLIEIEIGPVTILAKWPRMANGKIIEKIETVEQAAQTLRGELE